MLSIAAKRYWNVLINFKAQKNGYFHFLDPLMRWKWKGVMSNYQFFVKILACNMRFLRKNWEKDAQILKYYLLDLRIVFALDIYKYIHISLQAKFIKITLLGSEIILGIWGSFKGLRRKILVVVCNFGLNMFWECIQN